MARLTGFASVAAATREVLGVRDGWHGASRERSIAELDVGDITHAPHGRVDFGVRRRRGEANREVRVESFRLDVLERRFGGDHFTQRLQRLHDEKCPNAAERRVRVQPDSNDRARSSGTDSPRGRRSGYGRGDSPRGAASTSVRSAQRVQRRDEIGRDDFAVAAGDRRFDGLLQHVGRAKERVHDLAVEREIVAAHAVEHRLELVRQLGDDGVSHRRTHAFDRVDRAKNLTDGSRCARRRRVTLEFEQRVIDGGDVLAALREKELGVLERVHSGVAGAVLSPTRVERLRARGWVGTV